VHVLRELRRRGAGGRLPELWLRVHAATDPTDARVAAGLSLGQRPASERRHLLSYRPDEIAELRERLRAVPPECR
jgi:hypothetical protein